MRTISRIQIKILHDHFEFFNAFARPYKVLWQHSIYLQRMLHGKNIIRHVNPEYIVSKTRINSFELIDHVNWKRKCFSTIETPEYANRQYEAFKFH